MAIFLVINVFFGVLGLIQAARNPHAAAGRELANIFLVFVSMTLGTLPHELAHALVGRLAGLKVVDVWIGRGPRLFAARLFGFPVKFNLIPMGGFAFLIPGHSDHLRGRFFAAIAAGPLANIALAAVVWPWVDWSHWGMSQRLCLPEMFVIGQALVVAENLFPYSVQSAYGLISSDGQFLCQLLFNRTAGAARFCNGIQRKGSG